MSDSLGKIIVCGDYEGDLNGIEQGNVHKQPGVNREVLALNGDVQCPSLHPIGNIFVLKDGRRCFAKDADESFIEQWKAEKDDGAFDLSECTLSELSALISPHLIKGAMEFVAVHGSSAYSSEAVLLEHPKGGRSKLYQPTVFVDVFTTKGSSFDQMAPPNGMPLSGLTWPESTLFG